jgi:putative amide transporter protein
MLIGIVLLYVGAALLVNGIWLVGQARTRSLHGNAPASAGERAVDAEAHYSFMQPREIAVINVFTGGVGVVVAAFLVIIGGIQGNRPDVANAAFILLFAFTYLWIAANQFLGAGNHAFGWFCFFIAVTAVPTGVYEFANANGNVASIWLGIDWFVWAVLWFLFFLLLTLDRQIQRLVGWATIVVAIGTAWVFGYALLQGALSF